MRKWGMAIFAVAFVVAGSVAIISLSARNSPPVGPASMTAPSATPMPTRIEI